MLLSKRLQERRKNIEAHRHPANQADGAADRPLAVENTGAGTLEILEHPFAQPKERRSGGRNADLTSEPQEQLLLQFLFQQQNLAADGRLRKVQLQACARERSRPRDGSQYLELAKVHACPGSGRLLLRLVRATYRLEPFG